MLLRSVVVKPSPHHPDPPSPESRRTKRSPGLLARALGLTGRTLKTLGVLILLFVAYQLWGTGIAEARAQSSLESDFEELLADFDVTAATVVPTTTPSATPTSTAPTATTAPPPPPDDGDAVARIVIPKIGVDKIIVEGVSRSDLQKGPGHYPGTPLPGQAGNASIAGHRTTYGAPFFRVDELEVGDEILVTTLQGSFKYIVSGQSIVAPSEVSVIDDFGDNRLTLTSCHPKYTARERIIITAMLEEEPAPAPPSTVPPIGDGIPGIRTFPANRFPEENSRQMPPNSRASMQVRLAPPAAPFCGDSSCSPFGSSSMR